MMMLATMAGSGAMFLEGREEQLIGESSLVHLLAVFVFVFLWKLHRFLGRTIFDELLGLSFSRSSTRHDDPRRSRPSRRDLKLNRLCSDLILPEQDDLWLQKQAPESTSAERLRFFVAASRKKESAAKALEAYLEWRTKLALPDGETLSEATGDRDADEWNMATAKALRMHGISKTRRLPQICRTYRGGSSSTDLCDDSGSRIFHVTPGQMDERLCPSVVYATVLACYLDQKLSRDSTERIAVVLDVRGGVGWRNLNAASQLPFIQHTCRLLLKMFPERLSRAVVYPIPASFVWLWSVASRCIEPKTREKIGLLSGTATIQSPPPTEQMIAYMSEETAHRLERERLATFVVSA